MKIILGRTLPSLVVLLLLGLTTAHAGEGLPHNSKRGSAPARSSAQKSDDDYAKYYFICSSPDSKHDKSLTIDYIVISLAEQRLYAYHGDELVAWSNVSTGKAGHETPVGTFKITQKHIDHYSSIYNNAPMPYFMRLTNDGVGLHAGVLPGYAASHGCIRLPMGMVKELYQHTASGTPVQVIAGPVDPSYASNKSPSFFPKA
ncbi:MAG: L,D-transpeptidase family protein [Methylacidiphilales bacterium]|nr:L,D-transpeptidase family protein [Candidatus Methylacidiphilales bacterium]